MNRLGLMVLLTLALTGWRVAAADDDFRVETKVFAGAGTQCKMVSEITTLFHSGRVYDYLDKPEEITVFDPQHERIILLDPARKVRTEVKHTDLARHCVMLRAQAAESNDKRLKFGVEPAFSFKHDPKTGEWSFSSDYLNYQVTTDEPSPGATARQYREFSDTYAQLNALTNNGSIAPFPRMAVNEALGKEGFVPTKVELTILPLQNLTGRKTVARSEHKWFWRLANSDLQRINETDTFLVAFKPVSPQEYIQRAGESKR